MNATFELIDPTEEEDDEFEDDFDDEEEEEDEDFEEEGNTDIIGFPPLSLSFA